MTAEEKLKKLAELARKRFNAGIYWFPVQDSPSRYIRITGNGYLPVSLASETPCKSLVDNGTKREINAESCLEKALSHVRNSELVGREPNTKQEEHRIQAFIIREYVAGRFGSKELGITDLVDELYFVTDELVVEDIRADLVFLGMKDNKYFPVFIELKIKRLATELEKQLAGISCYSRQHAGAFSKLLKSAAGMADSDIRVMMDKPLKVAIWPKTASGKERADNVLQTSDIKIITYEESDGKFLFTYQLV